MTAAQITRDTEKGRRNGGTEPTIIPADPEKLFFQYLGAKLRDKAVDLVWAHPDVLPGRIVKTPPVANMPIGEGGKTFGDVAREVLSNLRRPAAGVDYQPRAQRGRNE